jgi:alpha-mannosidase
MEKKKAYAVATAHLDTVWRWSLAETIEEYIPDTLSKNFDLIEKYPFYKFNFEGAHRYALIEEYYPKAFEIIRDYVRQGKWYPAGAEYENGDVNIPSPEALFRNILVGSRYFRDKFGVTSNELFLPDCFGFGWAMPSVINHAGLNGFTTQKLSWGCAYGLPFDLGILRGPDSKEIFANLNARSYRYKFSNDLRVDRSIVSRVEDNAAKASLPWANHLYGDGDKGGAPTEDSVRAVNGSVKKNDNSDFEIISADSGQIFRDMEKLEPAERAKLPVWNTELLMTSHGAGGYTSRVHSKRLNFLCEQAAFATEPMCCMAHFKGLGDYPKENLNKAWKKVLAHHFHDDITGTSIMSVYNDAWNDYSVAISYFRNEYLNAARKLSYAIDTSWVNDTSSCIVVTNSTQFKRSEAIKIKGHLGRNANHIRAFDSDGNEIPSQLTKKKGKMYEGIIYVTLEPYSVRAYEIKPSESACSIDTGLRITNHSLENGKYLLRFNRNGDIAYLYDKELDRQVISSPIKLALLHDVGSLAYPSWEMRKEDIDSEPYCYANTPEFSIVEAGPARITIEVKRDAEYSVISQRVSLSLDSKTVEVTNRVDWRTRRSMMKAVFPFSASDSNATYDLGLGVIKRPNNTEKLYEVPAQHWADITDRSGDFGAAVLSDCKYGWDKPSDNTLRLTCLHTPAGAFTKETRQDLQDLGLSEFRFAIYSHKNGYENGVQREAMLFTNPLNAIETKTRSKGVKKLGSFLTVSTDDVLVRAVKLCEEDDSVIVRVNEANGMEQKKVSLNLSSEITAAYLANSNEDITGKADFDKRTVVFDMSPFEVRTFRIELKKSKKSLTEKCIPIELPFNSKGFSDYENLRHIILQGSGLSLPLEQMPDKFTVGGIEFVSGRKADDRYDVLVCRGQELDIHENASRIYFLAASTVGSFDEIFTTDGRGYTFSFRQLNEPIDTFDIEGLSQKGTHDGRIEAGFDFTHTHHPEGMLTQKAVFGLYSVACKGKKKFILPDNNKIVIIAATAVEGMDNASIVSGITRKLEYLTEPDEDIPPVDKLLDKTDFLTIRAGKIQDQRKSGKGKGFKRDNIITNIIRSYTKSEW